jgi:anaphase-promoting complex subunit 3
MSAIPVPGAAPPTGDAAGLSNTLYSWCLYSLQNHLHDNAIFLAERVCAEQSCDASKLLLATCHYSAGAANRAIAVLSGTNAPQNRYLLALCCMRLGRLPDAQTALLGPSAPDNEATAMLPNGAAGLYLMGMICLKMQHRQRAIKYLTRCLGLNPFMWSAYEALSQLGAPLPEGLVPPPPPTFGGGDGTMPMPVLGQGGVDVGAWGAAGADVAMAGGGGAGVGGASMQTPSVSASTPQLRTPQMPQFTPVEGGGAGPPLSAAAVPASATAASGSGIPGSAAIVGSLSTPNLQTPVVGGGAGAGGANPLSSAASPQPGGRRPGAGARAPPSSAVGPGPDSGRDTQMSAGAPPNVPGRRGAARLGASGSGVPVRRSSRLSSTGGPADAAGGPASAREMPPPSLPRGGGVGPAVAGGSADGSQAALWLLRQLATGYRALCLYKCHDAVLAFRALPQRQYQTGWVLNQVGRAHFEMVQYSEALKAFEQAQAIEPHRLCGMEVHSTILWHLKREVALCYLAKRALDFERTSAYACCVVGNCFSLQKEHDTALKFFQRAIQLQPDFAYAYTLSGHEYSANDDFEKAMACYRSAIRIDERHYNAWYGLGNIYYRQEKYDFSEHHLRKALAINPCSSPLYCYLGMALHANQKTMQALEMLSNAITIDPKNPLARFQKAQVLLSTEQYELALTELKQLVEMAPKEGSVYFVLGKVYKKLGDQSKAMVHLTRALDLSPKDAQQIKAAILNLEKEDNAEEEEEL